MRPDIEESVVEFSRSYNGTVLLHLLEKLEHSNFRVIYEVVEIKSLLGVALCSLLGLIPEIGLDCLARICLNASTITDNSHEDCRLS